jgi:tryptophan-rich sensory protein
VNLWLLTASVFLAGVIIAVLLGRSRQTGSSVCILAEATGAYSAYILLVGLFVAFNLFRLDKIDPFFKTTRWHAFNILYWPSWVLTFAPLVIGGTLVIVSANTSSSRRLRMLSLLLVIALALFEAVYLLNIGVLGKVLVQLAGISLFAAYVYSGRERNLAREIKIICGSLTNNKADL